MSLQQKYDSFEYLLYQLLRWYDEETTDKEDYSSFTRLKVLKLLFFASAVKTTDKHDLLDIFNNFWAMQHGPVESDIYNAMVNDSLRYYSFKERSVSMKESYKPTSDSENKNSIDNSIRKLRELNSKIVLLSAFDLVDISHYWDSWKVSMHIANLNNKGSEKMSISDIRNSQPFFAL